MNTITRTLTSVLLLLCATLTWAGTPQKRQAKAATHKTMEQLADEFAKKAEKARLINVKDLAASRPMRAASVTEKWETIVDEDFSLMTKGTEDVPDSIMHPQEYFTTYSYDLPDSLFHTPDWFGLGVYEAGGNVALAYPNLGGLLNTPLMNLTGKLRLKTRVKAINKKALFFFNVCAGGYYSPHDPTGSEMHYYYLNPEDGWQDVEITVENPYSGDDCFVQINAMAYNKGGLVFDYLTVERDANYIPVPQNPTASKFTYDGFTASWDEALGADGYNVNLYRKYQTGTENIISTCDFENSTVSGNTVTGLGKGWTAYLEGEDYICDSVAYEGTHSLALTSNCDTLTFDAGNSYITDASFAVKLIVPEGVTAKYSGFGLSVKGYNYWWERTPTAGEWVTYKLSEDFANGFAPGEASQITIWGNNLGEGVYLLIDNLSAEATPEAEIELLKTDDTAETSIAYDGLDLQANEYYFTVQATTTDGRASYVTEPKYAFGVAAPHVKEATSVDARGAYTANWEAAPNATEYLLRSYSVFTVPADATDYDVFVEDFSPCAEGTDSTYVYKGNYKSMSLDDYADNIGWTGTGVLLGQGMVGCYKDDYGSTFDLYSPEISVGANDGNYKVTVTFMVENAGETFVVQGDQTDYQTITCETAGTYTATVSLKGGTDYTHLLFYTVNATPFLIDNVIVTQDVKAGDKIYTYLDQYTTDETAARVTGLEPDENSTFAYNVVSYYTRGSKTYNSDRSDNQFVDLNAAGINRLVDNTTSEVEVYDLSGRRVSGARQGIYLIKQGDKVTKVVKK